MSNRKEQGIWSITTNRRADKDGNIDYSRCIVEVPACESCIYYCVADRTCRHMRSNRYWHCVDGKEPCNRYEEYKEEDE